MRIIICGAGQVGASIANHLSKEDNFVTVIDLDSALINKMNDEMDVKGIQGHASNPDILNAAGAADADMIIAVTRSDEVNMVACQIAHSLFGVPKKIARIRDQSYLQPAWSNLFSRSHMPIDVIISPEVVVANDIFQRLAVPGSSYVANLADGMAHLVSVVCDKDCPVINTPLKQLRNLFPDLSFQVVAILRNNKPIIPDKDRQILPGDEVFFVVDSKHLKRTMGAFGHEEKEARKIVIAGGGNIGFGLTEKLAQAKGRGIQIKMIENDPDRARYLSEKLPDVVILNGNSLDQKILDEARIDKAETFVAVTNDDESNILASLLAKQQGAGRAVTLVNNNIYSPLVGPLGVDTIVNPRAMIVSSIMQHVRKGRIKSLYNLRDGFAEIIEAEVSESSSIINSQISELELPQEIIVAAIIRDETVIIPEETLTIKAKDRVIILADNEHIYEVEKMFSVQVDLF